MPIRSYHINEKFGLSRALFPILLSKITKISPKNLSFLPIKFDRVVTDNFWYYHSDPQASAVPGGYLTQKIWIDFWTASQPLCSGGPLMRLDLEELKIEAIGVTSFGNSGCDSSTPGFYTNNFNYIPWIKDFMLKSSI